ncbi:MAG: hypothetical protein IKR19_07955 [Acholeplasmatales bacterium]|nr:hypothetical protein [Acholeplasmatales bacterium]
MIIINESTDIIYVDKDPIKPKNSLEIDEDDYKDLLITSYNNGSVQFIIKEDSILLHCSGNLTAIEKDVDSNISIIAIKELMSRRRYKRQRKYYA